MPTYNKLVRDKIPGIIEDNGQHCNVVTLDAYEYTNELKRKLCEELEEYLAASETNDSLDELADLIEVIHALADVHGSSPQELEEIRLKKAHERGGFKDRLFLIGVEE